MNNVQIVSITKKMSGIVWMKISPIAYIYALFYNYITVEYRTYTIFKITECIIYVANSFV